jgi:LysM repeat protein
MSQIINEELSRMFYLLDHKRGVVISEQDAAIAATEVAPTTAETPTTAAAPTIAAPTTASSNQEYVVQKGDTLGKIGQKFGVQWKDIASLNQIKNVNLIRVGQKLQIPGKTQTTTTTATQADTKDLVSAAGTNVSSLLDFLFAKMPSFKTFGKVVDKGGVVKGIGANLTVDEIKQKYPTELIGMPITGFKFYPSNENGPFTKETVDGVYLNYLNDVKTTPIVYSEPTGTTETITDVTQELATSRRTKRADKRICRIINKNINNNTPMGSVLGDVCQVLEMCKTNKFIDETVTLEACKKVETTGEDETNTNNEKVEGGKIPIDVS